MTPEQPADYGLWTLVVINSLVFIIFAFSFARREECEATVQFGDEYARYARHTPRFVPTLSVVPTAEG